MYTHCKIEDFWKLGTNLYVLANLSNFYSDQI